jgi:hypothetical protein
LRCIRYTITSHWISHFAWFCCFWQWIHWVRFKISQLISWLIEWERDNWLKMLTATTRPNNLILCTWTMTSLNRIVKAFVNIGLHLFASIFAWNNYGCFWSPFIIVFIYCILFRVWFNWLKLKSCLCLVVCDK